MQTNAQNLKIKYEKRAKFLCIYSDDYTMWSLKNAKKIKCHWQVDTRHILYAVYFVCSFFVFAMKNYFGNEVHHFNITTLI